MGQIDLAFTSKDIDPSDHILSVLLEADSFVYGVFDKKHNLLAAGNHIIDLHSEAPLAAILKDKHISLDYSKTILTYSTSEFAHLSALDFGAGDFGVYFNDMSQGDKILSDRFTDSDVHVVFPVNKKFRAGLIKALNPTSEIHISTAMRQHIYPSQSKRNIVLVGSDKLHYMSYNGGDLTMYNMYKYRTKEDFLYFLQLATDFTGFDREADILEVGGWLDKTSEIYKLTSPYFRHIDWVDMPYMNLSSSHDHHLKHHYFALYASALCVS